MYREPKEMCERYTCQMWPVGPRCEKKTEPSGRTRTTSPQHKQVGHSDSSGAHLAPICVQEYEPSTNGTVMHLLFGSHGLFQGSCLGLCRCLLVTSFSNVTQCLLARGLGMEGGTSSEPPFHAFSFRLPIPAKDTSSVQDLLIDADEVPAATEDGGRERGLHRCGGSLDGLFLF